MTFFKSLFGNKKEIVEDLEFSSDFYSSLKRYLCLKKNETIECEFKDEKGNIIPPSYAFEETYSKWKGIKSAWDKRSLIFEILDELYLNKIEKWKIIERYTIDRYPERALQFVNKYANEEDFNNSDFLTSLAKCFFVQSKYEEGIQYAKKALEIDNKKESKIILADLLHLSNNHNDSHKLYEEILLSSKLEDNDEKEISLLEIVGYEYDILNSSVYAVGLLNNDQTNEEIWNQIAEEFYYCPYFRSQHAFWLFKRGENLKGIAKLISLAQEFPDFEDGVVNAHSSILQFRKQLNKNDLWEAELEYLSKIIENNNWKKASH